MSKTKQIKELLKEGNVLQVKVINSINMGDINNYPYQMFLDADGVNNVGGELIIEDETIGELKLAPNMWFEFKNGSFFIDIAMNDEELNEHFELIKVIKDEPVFFATSVGVQDNLIRLFDEETGYAQTLVFVQDKSNRNRIAMFDNFSITPSVLTEVIDEDFKFDIMDLYGSIEKVYDLNITGKDAMRLDDILDVVKGEHETQVVSEHMKINNQI